MPNGFLKLILAIIALTAFFATEYFHIQWPYLVIGIALWRFAIIEAVECSVAGTLAALEHYNYEQATIDYADERDFAPEPTTLNSKLFADRMHRFDN